MKFLDMPELNKLSMGFFRGLDLGDRLLYGSIDAYSCKKVKADKRLSAELERKLSNEYPPDSPHISAESPLGPIGRQSTRDLLCSLISTLNNTFADYDFSSVRPENFTREMYVKDVRATINSACVNAVEKAHPGFRDTFWATLDRVITLGHCEIYRLDMAQMPEGEAHIEPINYFFFNKHRKMILFFNAYAKSKLHGTASVPPSQADDAARAVDDDGDDDDEAAILAEVAAAAGAAGAAAPDAREKAEALDDDVPPISI